MKYASLSVAEYVYYTANNFLKEIKPIINILKTVLCFLDHEAPNNFSLHRFSSLREKLALEGNIFDVDSHFTAQVIWH